MTKTPIPHPRFKWKGLHQSKNGKKCYHLKKMGDCWTLSFYDERLQEYSRRNTYDLIDEIQVLKNISFGNKVWKSDRLPIKLGHKIIGQLMIG